MIKMITWAFCVACTARLFAWEMGDPIVTYWAGPGFPGHPEKLTDRAALQLKDCGFNMVWTQTPEELDVASRHGLRALYDLRIQDFDLDDAQAVAKLATRIAEVKNHPALYLYHHADEPSARRFESLKRVRRWLSEQDPRHGTWVNLLPIYANNRQMGVEGDNVSAYTEHVRMFTETYRPDFLSYDHYQFSNGGDGWRYLQNLEIVRSAAATKDIPFMNGVQACTWVPGDLASPSSPRIPGPDELRYLVFTTLAYGAQGIYYYVYSHPGHRGSIANLDGTEGPNFATVKKLNRKFLLIAKELQGFKLQGAYLQGRHAPGTQAYGPQAVLDVAPKSETVDLKPGQELSDTTLVSRFVCPGSPDYFMVVNLDYRKCRTITLTAPSPIERFDAKTGGWCETTGKNVELEFPRGSGLLLRLKR